MLERAHVTVITTRQARIRNVIALQDSWDGLLLFEPCMRKTARKDRRWAEPHIFLLRIHSCFGFRVSSSVP